MTARGDEIVSRAQGWLGTPYQHQASCKGAGTDCLGLLRGLWREVYGAEPRVVPAYTADWSEPSGREDLLNAAQGLMLPVTPGTEQPGDVLLFRMALGAPAKHAAIVSGDDLILHAYWGRAVCETRLVPWWRRRIAAAFKFPGVEH